MEDDEDRELEHYVWQHKKESLRKIKNGMLKEFGRTKGIRWITKIRKQAEQVEVITGEENGLTIEISEGEEKDETKKDEETKSEDDQEIIKMESQIRRLNKETELKQTEEKLAFATKGLKNVVDLCNRINDLEVLRSRDKKFMDLLKERIESALKEPVSTYCPNARCPKCNGRFLWRWSEAKALEDKVRCYVCQEHFTLVD